MLEYPYTISYDASKLLFRAHLQNARSSFPEAKNENLPKLLFYLLTYIIVDNNGALWVIP